MICTLKIPCCISYYSYCQNKVPERHKSFLWQEGFLRAHSFLWRCSIRGSAMVAEACGMTHYILVDQEAGTSGWSRALL